MEISPDTTTRPVFTSVSHATRPVGSSAHHGVEDAVGDLVGDLVRVAFSDRLGGEQVLVVSQGTHGISKESSAVVSSFSRSMTAAAARTGRRTSAVSPVCSPSARSWRTSTKPSDSILGRDPGDRRRGSRARPAGGACAPAPARARRGSSDDHGVARDGIGGREAVGDVEREGVGARDRHRLEGRRRAPVARERAGERVLEPREHLAHAGRIARAGRERDHRRGGARARARR